MSQHALYLGALDLIGIDFAAYKIETIAEGMDFGSAQPQDVITQTLLQDGSSVTTERWENREITFGVLISGPDLIAVAEGEAALYAELGRRNVLTWTPPDGWGPSSVFDVLTSWAEFEFDDWGEMKPGTIGRRFVVRLTCAPFARSEDQVEVEAVGSGGTPPTPVTQVVDSCDSASGWSASSGGTLSAGGGAITVSFPPIAPGGSIGKAIVVDATTTPLLFVDWQPAGGNPGTLRASSGGYLPVLASGPSPDNAGYTRTWFTMSASLTSVSLGVENKSLGSAFGFRVAHIGRTNVDPTVGTGRQQFRSVNVLGSARTQGSIAVEHETSALGEVLVYTNEDDLSGYQPACRGSGYRTAGGTESPDSATASGEYAPLNSGTPETFEIPARALPAGSYSIMARIRGDATAVTGVSWTASTLVGSTLYATQSGSTILLGGTTTSWKLYEVARVTLPPDDLPPGTSQKVRVTLSSSSAIYLDELFLFNTDIGDLTWVDCGTSAPSTGGASNRLWIDTATLDRPREAIWLGTAADGSDRRHALGSEVRSLGTHVLAPGDLNLFTLTSNALNAAASARYYPRWPNNAGMIAA